MPLDRRAVLTVSPDVHVTLRSDGTTEVAFEGARLVCRCNLLRLLDAFRAPTILSHVLDSHAIASAAEWIDLTVTVQRLVDMGALRVQGAPQSTHIGRSYRFEQPSQHILMLDDRPRTDAFLGAIRETVGPNDVVIDVGTGTGVLAIAAARAGARHVYALEAGNMADHAKSLIHVNGLADRVTVVEGWSTQLDLPERGTVLVSETIGSEAFDEEILYTMWDAKRRLLVSDAQLLPSRLSLFAVIVEIPDDVWADELYTEAAIERWRAWYGIEFQALLQIRKPVQFLAPRASAARWKRLSEVTELGSVDFHNPPLTIHWQAQGRIHEASTRSGVMLFFEITLGSRSYSQDPRAPETTRHWPCPVWITPTATTVDAGSVFSVEYWRLGASVVSLTVT